MKKHADFPDFSYYVVLKNIFKMLKRQGLSPTIPSEKDAVVAFKRRNYMILSEGNTRYVVINASTGATSRKDNLKQVVREVGIIKNSSWRAVVVSFSDPSSNILKNVGKNTTDATFSRVTFMSAKQFVVDRETHVVCMKHEVVPAEEVAVLLDVLDRVVSDFPVIRAADPGAVYINAQPGDVVHISRILPGSGRVDTYRRVV